MSTEAKRLAKEAERRRSSLDSTLDALKDRFSPSQIAEEVAASLRDGQGAEMVRTLNRQIRDNPLALGLIGAGAAWLLLGQGVRDPVAAARSRLLDRRDELRFDRERGSEFERPSTGYGDGSVRSELRELDRDDGHGVASTGSYAAAAVTGAASSAADAVASTADGVAEQARRLGHEASDAVLHVGDAVQREASEIGERVSHFRHRAKKTFLDTLRDEPLVLGALAVSIGAAIGAALPSTRVEDEWLGDARDTALAEVTGPDRSNWAG